MSDYPDFPSNRLMAALIAVALVALWQIPSLARMAQDAARYDDTVKMFRR